MIRNRLLRGAVSNCIGKIATVGVWFFLTPFVLSRLGVDAYALWVIVSAFFSYGMLLELGIGGAVIKYVAEHVARGDRSRAHSVIASATWLYLGLGSLAVAVGAIAAPAVPALMNLDPSASRLILLTGLNVGIAICIVPASAVLRGLHRYDVNNAVVAGNALLEGAAVLAVLYAGWGVAGMLVAVIGVNLVTGLAAFALVAAIAPDLRVGLHGASVASFRQIARFSTSLFAIQAGTRMQNRAAEFVITAFQTLSSVTPYALARKLAELSESLAIQVVAVILPVASELDAGYDQAALRKVYLTTTRVVLATVVPLAVVLGLTGSGILRLWVGPAYAEHGPLVALLAAAAVLTTSQRPASEILQGIGQHRIVAIATMGGGLATIALSMLLVPSLGLLGVAVGALVPSTVAALGVVIPFTHRQLRISWRTSLRDIWAPALVPAAPAALVLWSLQRNVEAPAAAALLVWVACTMVVYGVGYLCMPASAAERQLIRDGLTGGSRRLRRLAPGV